MKRMLCLFIACVLSLGLLVGCTNKKNSSTNTGDYEVNLHPDKSVTATLTVAVTNYTQEKNIITELAKVLNKEYPNVTVKLEPFSTPISQQYGSWFSTESVPDILINNSFDMFTLSDKGILLDLDPYLKAEAKDEASDFNIADYYEAYIKLGQEKFDGAQYMMPRSADRVVCHYNKAIFKAADVDMNLVKNGWTWDDFLTVCATLRDYYDRTGKNDYYLVDPYFTWEAVYNPIFEAYGVEYFDADGKVKLQSDATKKALEFIKSIIDKRYAAPMSVEQAGMQANKGCMLFHSQASSNIAGKLAQYYENKDVDEYYDVVTMPVFKGAEKIGCGAAGYSVYSGSKNRDIAWQFLKVLLSKEGQNILADSGANYVPVRKDMADYTDPENHWGKGFEKCNMSAFTYNSGSGTDPDWNCYTTYIAQQKPRHASNINSAISGLITNFCGGKTYDEAIKSCVNAISRYLMM